MNILPDKPSELIRVAVHDLDLCENDPGFRIDMGDWCADRSGICHVCLGGAVIAKSLGRVTVPELLPQNDKNKIYALDYFRRGSLILGTLKFVPVFPPNLQAHIEICAYADDPTKFKSQMLEMAAMLEKEGL